MRILLYATYPTQPIGYARVAYRLANWLAAQPDVDLYYFGTSNYPEGACRDRTLDLRIHWIDVLAETDDRDAYGIDILASWMDKVKPDVFLIYNDIIVTCRAFNALLGWRRAHPTTRVIAYLDLVYPFEKADLVRHVDQHTDQIWVFSPCWARNLEAMGVAPAKLHVFPHGFSADQLYRLPAAAAKAYFGIPTDAFVILNLNRNTYRKAQDICIAAFLQFLKAESFDPRLRLFLQCDLTSPSGYGIVDVLEVECIKQGLPPEKVRPHILRSSSTGTLSDTEVNLLYNACDVGINTCIGEGFGLCNMEHAALGAPQLVSAVGGLADIFAEGGGILIQPRVWARVPTRLDEHSGDVGYCEASDFAAGMSVLFRDTARRAREGAFAASRFPEVYRWETLLETLSPRLRFFSPAS